MFLGEKEIASLEEQGDIVVIAYKGEEDKKASLPKKVYDLIVSETIGKGNVVDNVRMYFAKKFLAELASFDLDFYMVEQVTTGMQTLAHNLREEAIGKAFGCSSAYDIKIKKLIE